MGVLGDADAQDMRGVGGEFPGHLVAHAAAQVVLVRRQAHRGGGEAGPELAGLQAVVKDHGAVGFGQAQEVLLPAFVQGDRFGQVHLVFDGDLGVGQFAPRSGR